MRRLHKMTDIFTGVYRVLTYFLKKYAVIKIRNSPQHSSQHNRYLDTNDEETVCSFNTIRMTCAVKTASSSNQASILMKEDNKDANIVRLSTYITFLFHKILGTFILTNIALL
jgi:hypothetical protein